MKYIILFVFAINGLFASEISLDMQAVQEKVKHFYKYIEKNDTSYKSAPYNSLVKEFGYPEVYIHLGYGEPYFTKKLNMLLVSEMKKDVSYCLDYNFLTNGQDDWLTDFKIQYKQVNATQINVIFSFKNFSQKVKNTFYFKKFEDTWLIEDINNAESLLKLLESCKHN